MFAGLYKAYVLPWMDLERFPAYISEKNPNMRQKHTNKKTLKDNHARPAEITLK